MSKHKRVLLLGLVLFVYLVRGVRVEDYRDAKASGGEIRCPPFDVIAVHASRPRYIKVAGQVYRGVRGVPPYYLQIPGTNLILFVTRELHDRACFHVVNSETGKYIAVEGIKSSFGINIASSPGQISDSVESFSSNRLVLLQRSIGWTNRSLLNLDARKLESMDESNAK